MFDGTPALHMFSFSFSTIPPHLPIYMHMFEICCVHRKIIADFLRLIMMMMQPWPVLHMCCSPQR